MAAQVEEVAAEFGSEASQRRCMKEGKMYCDNCGQSIPAGVSACPRCNPQTQFTAATNAVARDRVGRLPNLTNAKLESGITRLCAPIFQAIEDGLVLRMLVALAFRVLGALAVLGSLYLVVQISKEALTAPTTQGTIGGLLLAAFVFLIAVCNFFVLYYRAATISSLGNSSFTVIPILSVMLRTFGESYAFTLVLVGIAGAAFTWVSGFNPTAGLRELGPLIPNLGFQEGGTFLVGMEFLLLMALFGFGCLILFYFFAEAVLVIVHIAKNTDRMAKAAESAS